jgi:hypothetical protein
MPFSFLYKFYKPLRSEYIEVRQAPHLVDVESVKESWKGKLLAMQEKLSLEGITTKIQPYGDLSALYEEERPLMWPGENVTLVSYKWKDTAFDSDKRPSFGISTIVLTSDNQLVLTLRGTRTSMYPNRLCGIGGVPESCREGIYTHQKKELKEEADLEHTEYRTLFFDALVEDQEAHKRGVVLTGHTTTYLATKEILERVKRRTHQPPDVHSLIALSALEGELFEALASRAPSEFVPTTLGGLICYGEHQFGKEWANKLMKKMQ